MEKSTHRLNKIDFCMFGKVDLGMFQSRKKSKTKSKTKSMSLTESQVYVGPSSWRLTWCRTPPTSSPPRASAPALLPGLCTRTPPGPLDHQGALSGLHPMHVKARRGTISSIQGNLQACRAMSRQSRCLVMLEGWEGIALNC